MPLKCPPYHTPPNTIATPPAAYFGHAVMLSCKPGFRLSSEGAAAPLCTADGTYAPVGKRCIPNECPSNVCPNLPTFLRINDPFYDTVAPDTSVPLPAFKVTCRQGFKPWNSTEVAGISQREQHCSQPQGYRLHCDNCDWAPADGMADLA